MHADPAAALAAEIAAGRWPAEDFLPSATPFAARLPPAERPRLLAVLAAELGALHEGNYARFGLRPAEFDVWLARPRE